MILLGLQEMGILKGPRRSIWPSEARVTLAWFSKTSNVANGVISKSRLAIKVGCGVLVDIREHLMRAETAGLIGIRRTGLWRMRRVSESSWGPGSTLWMREAGRNGTRSFRPGIAFKPSNMLDDAGPELGRFPTSKVIWSVCFALVKLAEAVKVTATFGKRMRGRWRVASMFQMANMVGLLRSESSPPALTAMKGSPSSLTWLEKIRSCSGPS